jgi:hypothetical protein
MYDIVRSILVKYEVIEISGYWYEAVLRKNEDAIGRSYPIEPWLPFIKTA